MVLIGELKEKVDAAQSDMEKKSILAKAGMLITDKELTEVSGGSGHLKFGNCAISDGRQAINDVNNPVVMDIYSAISKRSKADEIPELFE